MSQDYLTSHLEFLLALILSSTKIQVCRTQAVSVIRTVLFCTRPLVSADRTGENLPVTAPEKEERNKQEEKEERKSEEETGDGYSD